jgi:hypothetical protein
MVDHEAAADPPNRADQRERRDEESAVGEGAAAQAGPGIDGVQFGHRALFEEPYRRRVDRQGDHRDRRTEQQGQHRVVPRHAPHPRGEPRHQDEQHHHHGQPHPGRPHPARRLAR